MIFATNADMVIFTYTCAGNYQYLPDFFVEIIVGVKALKRLHRRPASVDALDPGERKARTRRATT